MMQASKTKTVDGIINKLFLEYPNKALQASKNRSLNKWFLGKVF